jgi:sterol desaturase/sphingolipid hydroxylase (fatty acid hydroxylase superfamily)
MSDHVFVVVLVGSQALLVGLDVLDRFLPAHEPRPAGRASPRAIGFLALVLVAYFAIQLSLARLLPDAAAVVARVGAALGGTAGHAALGPLLIAVAVGLYAGGLVDYLMHRFVSHHRLLFFTHEYHHVPSEVFLLMPGLAARPFAILASFPTTVATAVSAYGTLALLGQPVADTTALKLLVIIQVMLLVTSHSSFLRRFRAVHVAMKALGLTTAREHLVHHTTDLHGNYANLTAIWDRVFGTYLDPDLPQHQGHPLGLPYDQDWLGAVTASHLKLPESVRERFDIGRWCNLAAKRVQRAA